MVRPTESLQLFIGEHQSVGCEPHQEGADDDDGQVFDVLVVPVRPVAAAHAAPQVIVGGQEQRADQNRLDDEQPGKDTAHEGDAHLLAVRINLGGQVIAGKRQLQQRRDGDEVGRVTHPLIVGIFL